MTEDITLFSKAAEDFVIVSTLEAIDGGIAAWAAAAEYVKSPAYFHDRDNALTAMVISDLWAQGREPDFMAVHHEMTQIPFAIALDALKNIRLGSQREHMRRDPSIDHGNSLAAAIGVNGLLAGNRRPGRRDEIAECAKIIADHWKQRTAIELLDTATKKLRLASGRTQSKIVAESVITDLCNVLAGRSGMRTMAEHSAAALVVHDANRDAKPKPRPQWGLPSMDKICAFRGTGMTVLAGTPGTGKTSLALQCATATAKHINSECSVGIVSREMPGIDLARILMARALKVKREDIEEGRLTEIQRAEATLLSESLEHGRGIVIHDSFQDCSAKSVCAWARQLHVRSGGKFSLLIIDHLQLLSPEHPKQNEYEKLSVATHSLKNLALELGICVLLLSQLNNESQKRKPGYGGMGGAQDFELTDLRGSGTIGQDADQVVILCNQQPGPGVNAPIVKAKVAKNRWGSQDSRDYKFDKVNGQQYLEIPPGKSGAYERMESQPADDEDLF